MSARQGRNTGLIITIIFFVFTTIVGIALAVMFSTKVEENRKAAEEAKAELAKFISSGDRAKVTDLEAEATKADPNNKRNVFTHLTMSIDRLKRNITGSEVGTVDQVEKQLVEAGVASGRNVIEVLTELKGERDNQKEQVTAHETQIKELEDSLKSLTARLADEKKAAEQDSSKITDTLATIQKDRQDFEKESQSKLEEIDKSVAENAKKHEEEAVTKADLIASLQKEVDILTKTINNLKGKRATDMPSAPDPALHMDGQVVAVPAKEDNIVYINLGRQDHLVLGMTFEVYDSSRGVEFEAQDKSGQVQLKRGKATIEVVSMSDKSAVCRVVRESFGQPVLVRDHVANLVYDKHRKFKFYVYGEFDLDGDGKPSLSDKEMIENLITNWGGVIVKPEDRKRQLGAAIGIEAAEQNLLPLDTDFLLVGLEPTLPASAAATDPQAKARNDALKEIYDQYARLRGEARAMSIPVLNQNRFMALIGYYQQ